MKKTTLLAALSLTAASAQAALVTMTVGGVAHFGDGYTPWGIAEGAHAYVLEMVYDDTTAPLDVGLTAYAAGHSMSLRFDGGAAVATSLRSAPRIHLGENGAQQIANLSFSFEIPGAGGTNNVLTTYLRSDDGGALVDTSLERFDELNLAAFEERYLSVSLRNPAGVAPTWFTAFFSVQTVTFAQAPAEPAAVSEPATAWLALGALLALRRPRRDRRA